MTTRDDPTFGNIYKLYPNDDQDKFVNEIGEFVHAVADIPSDINPVSTALYQYIPIYNTCTGYLEQVIRRNTTLLHHPHVSSIRTIADVFGGFIRRFNHRHMISFVTKCIGGASIASIASYILVYRSKRLLAGATYVGMASLAGYFINRFYYTCSLRTVYTREINSIRQEATQILSEPRVYMVSDPTQKETHASDTGSMELQQVTDSVHSGSRSDESPEEGPQSPSEGEECD